MCIDQLREFTRPLRARARSCEPATVRLAKRRAKPQRLRTGLVVAALALTCYVLPAHAEAPDLASRAPAAEVFDWNIFAADVVADQLPSIQTHTLAIVQIGVHDALNAIDSRYEPYEYAGSAIGASLPAAVATAAHDTLTRMLPAAATQINARYAQRLAAIPNGASKKLGILTGRAAAAAILVRRGNEDLFGALTKNYTPGPALPGVYQLTPPFNTVFLAGWGELVPFAMRSNSQFRSRAFLFVSGYVYAKDYREVKDFGVLDSTKRSEEQTETAHFWFDVVSKEWHRAARKGLTDEFADEWQAARTLALVSIAMADGVIASAETKFHFNYWRPIMAIHAGSRDGNPFTRGDPAWEPLCATPPFPEYNSTHAVTGAAAARALALILGDRHTFTVDSPTLAGVSRTYRRFSAAATEEGLSRIFCGIHFRDGLNAGLEQGERIGRYVVRHLLRPVARDASQ
jgi:hypothetical protein